MDNNRFIKSETTSVHDDERLLRLLNSNNAIIYSYDIAFQKFTFISENIHEKIGYKASDIINDIDMLLQHIHPDDIPRVKMEINSSIEHGEGAIEYRICSTDGFYHWIYNAYKVIYDNSGNAIEFIGTWVDIPSSLLSNTINLYLNHDSLTKLLNRDEVVRCLKQLISRSETRLTNHILFQIDIDKFKIINTTCGHLAGDELLQKFASILKSTARNNDLIGRLGDDEFALVMANCSLSHAINYANELFEYMRKFRFKWKDKIFSINISIGIVLIDNQNKNIIDILSKANIACYTARNKGGNRIQIYNEADELLSAIHEEFIWTNRTHQALEGNHFLLYKQPIVSLSRKSQILHYEILIRILDKLDGIILPGKFLPAAEKHGLSVRIDKWVIDTLFTAFKSSSELLKSMGSCAINLSGQSIGNDELFKTIIFYINNDRELATKICFEITETAIVANLNSAIDFIKMIKEYGCKFSLDDFGTGLSSFAYLKALPIDYIKIDGSFVTRVLDSHTDEAFIKSINDISHAMGKKTIAEFAENNKILSKLRNLNVDFAQGYGIGKPELINLT